MDLGLRGKVSWVLGGSSGIGLAAARSLAAEGAAVALSARSEDRLRDAARAIATDTGGTCVPIPVDVTDPTSITRGADRARSELGDIDILLANAGGPPPGGFDSFEDSNLTDAHELLLASAWRLTKEVVPGMRARGGGCVIFVVSSSTKEVIDGLLLSNTMRPAIAGMAKSLSRELGQDGIRVVCLAPGRIDTPRVRFLDEARAAASGRRGDGVRGESQTVIPLGRYGRPEEIGDVVAFVASERASYLTGTTLLVDGGASKGVLS